jgi:uncharacterized protein with von Willebrand factor type A (vWA) domain
MVHAHIHFASRCSEQGQSLGFAVSTSEVIDATESLRYLDLMNKSALNACLRSALIKRPDPSGVARQLKGP